MTLRLFEPLGALEEHSQQQEEVRPAVVGPSPGVAIQMDNVGVRAAGHSILQNLNVKIPAGSHVAIVGPSGAGKSSLVGILLGWWRPATGEVLVDGRPLGSCLDQLRRETAWVDPAVHLWNRSFFENIQYGNGDGDGRPMIQVIEAADLRRVLEKLADGFQTRLGEGGTLVSGGEGQRVRLARALLRSNTRLIILDEPFRGLDRLQRRELLARARTAWQSATLLCVTHDVNETQVFDRVLVIENGRIAEDGVPAQLAASISSRYAALLRAEGALRDTTWADCAWRNVRIEDGTLSVNAREKQT